MPVCTCFSANGVFAFQAIDKRPKRIDHQRSVRLECLGVVLSQHFLKPGLEFGHEDLLFLARPNQGTVFAAQ